MKSCAFSARTRKRCSLRRSRSSDRFRWLMSVEMPAAAWRGGLAVARAACRPAGAGATARRARRALGAARAAGGGRVGGGAGAGRRRGAPGGGGGGEKRRVGRERGGV